jgi:hypothetical protein
MPCQLGKHKNLVFFRYDYGYKSTGRSGAHRGAAAFQTAENGSLIAPLTLKVFPLYFALKKIMKKNFIRDGKESEQRGTKKKKKKEENTTNARLLAKNLGNVCGDKCIINKAAESVER